VIERPKSNRSSLIRLLILVLAFFALTLIILLRKARPVPNQNMLAIGELANVNEVDIVIRHPVELDFKTKSEVLQLRRAAVHWYPSLLGRSSMASRGGASMVSFIMARERIAFAVRPRRRALYLIPIC